MNTYHMTKDDLNFITEFIKEDISVKIEALAGRREKNQYELLSFFMNSYNHLPSNSLQPIIKESDLSNFFSDNNKNSTFKFFNLAKSGTFHFFKTHKDSEIIKLHNYFIKKENGFSWLDEMAETIISKFSLNLTKQYTKIITNKKNGYQPKEEQLFAIIDFLSKHKKTYTLGTTFDLILYCLENSNHYNPQKTINYLNATIELQKTIPKQFLKKYNQICEVASENHPKYFTKIENKNQHMKRYKNQNNEFQSCSGHYKTYSLDLNLLSSKNKFNVTKKSSALHAFYKAFKQHAINHEYINDLIFTSNNHLNQITILTKGNSPKDVFSYFETALAFILNTDISTNKNPEIITQIIKRIENFNNLSELLQKEDTPTKPNKI